MIVFVLFLWCASFFEQCVFLFFVLFTVSLPVVFFEYCVVVVWRTRFCCLAHTFVLSLFGHSVVAVFVGLHV